MFKIIPLKGISLAGALALAFLSFNAPANAQALPGAAIAADITALKAARAKVEASVKAQDAAALAVDMAALKAAAEKLRTDVRSVKDGLAPQRQAVEVARRAFGDAERALRAARASRDAAKITTAQNNLLAAFQNLVTAQDALIAGATAIGLPAPTAEQAAVKIARDAFAQAKIRLGIARTSKNPEQIAAAGQALANASAALANAQAQVIASQPSGSGQDPLLQQAERVLAMAGDVATRVRAKRKA
jgi:hypothetical protein